MPGTFRSKNGATLSGHSDKWSNGNRSPNSHDAGQGSKGKRNQGTGLQGKLNTMPSNGVDTSKMKPEEKLKYFKSLGLMPGSPPTPEPEEAPKPPATNPVQELSSRLGKIFSTKPQLLQDIVKHLQGLSKDELKRKAVDILNFMKDNRSTNPDEVHGEIMSNLKGSTENKRSPNDDTAIKHRMTPEEFLEGNNDLPRKNLEELVKQASQFYDFEGALFYISAARDNVYDGDNVKEIVSSMYSTADSLGDLGFDLK